MSWPGSGPRLRRLLHSRRSKTDCWSESESFKVRLTSSRVPTTTNVTRSYSSRPVLSSRWRFKRNGFGHWPIAVTKWRLSWKALTRRAPTSTALIGELRAKLAELDYSEAAFREFRAAELAAEAERRRAELALVRARGETAAAMEALNLVARRRAERAEREHAAAQAASQLALHQELDRALTDLRTELNATFRPDLSYLASSFIRDLTGGRYTDLELDEDYVATLLDDGDPKTVISGGEEDVANLALRLAISQMIAERAGQPLSRS